MLKRFCYRCIINLLRNLGGYFLKKLISFAFVFIISFLLSCCSINFDYINPANTVTFDETNSKLTVHFIDVGQGDSILLGSKDEFVLIDAGEKEYGETVTEYLNYQNVATLKYVIATHPHSDHCGGLTEVINSVKCENFITAETDQQTSTWLDVLNAVDSNNVNYIDAKRSDTYSFGEAQFTILAPCSDIYDDYNNYSVVIKVTCGNASFLLTGDAEALSENEMIKSGEDLSADVLKIGHHGSNTSSSENFLKAVNPKYAVISCGKANDYGHPHEETLEKLEKLGITYLRTDLLHTIIATTDGSSVKFFTSDGELYSSILSSSQPQNNDTSIYIGNKNSKIFHRDNCSGVKMMNQKNRVEFYSRQNAIDSGYSPCSNCNP